MEIKLAEFSLAASAAFIGCSWDEMNEPSRHYGSAHKVRLQLQPEQEKRGDEARAGT